MMPHVEEMNEKDQEEGDVLGGLNDGDKNKKNEKNENEKKKTKKLCDTKEDAGDVDGGEDVGGGEGGGDYVIGGDGVAVLHGVQMAPFHMNMPALLGWEKGGSDTGKIITRKSHPSKGIIVEKEA